ncbi:MAG: helix-turn-helix domain-containing protein, partial [Clostridia bacterium]|nr:helix-turn-helix domain-containing protein [Clostridia bacterium]
DEGSFLLEPGAVVYLPAGSIHTFEILSDAITFFRVDFDILAEGETVLFSTHPLKMCRKAGPSFDRAVREMAERYEFLQDTVGKNALLCTAFRSLYEEREETGSRLEPAVRYLLEHLTEKVSVTELASMCYLSTAQFYNLFHAVYHTTPLEYRAALLYEKARSLLRTGSFTVTEISEMLGFESVSYFSRFFKKRSGASPAAYLRSAT